LPLSPTDILPLNVIRPQRSPARSPPRGPNGAMQRPPLLPAPPTGAVWIERPAFSPPEISRGLHYGISALSTRQPRLRSRRLREWTVEAVVFFLDSPHFGRAWQSVVGRNGANFSSDAFDATLGAFYVKLGPERQLMLEAWVAPDEGGAPPRYVSVVSKRVLRHSEWYSIVAASDGATMRLFVNGEVLGEAALGGGGLAVSPREEDGDFTFGVAMFGGAAADPCSCLISEARISEHVVPEGQWLWGPPPSSAAQTQATATGVGGGIAS